MPFCVKLAVLMTCTAITGITMGFLDTGGNVWCLDLWGKKSAPIMQALHFCFGLGAFIAPLVAEPFLSPHVIQSAVSLPENGSNITDSRLNMASLNFAHGPVSGRNNVRHLLGLSLSREINSHVSVSRIQPVQNYMDLSSFHNVVRIKNLVSPYNQNVSNSSVTQKKPEMYLLQKRDTDVNATSKELNSTTAVNGLNESMTSQRSGEQFNLNDYEDGIISNVSEIKGNEISNNNSKENIVNNETITMSSGEEETTASSSQSLPNSHKPKPKPSVTGAKVPVDKSPWNRKPLKSPYIPEKFMSNEKNTEDILDSGANNATKFSEATHATDVIMPNDTEDKIMQPHDKESGSDNDRTKTLDSSTELLYQELTMTVPMTKASYLQPISENDTHLSDLVKTISEEPEGASLSNSSVEHYLNKLQNASRTNPAVEHEQISAITTKPPKNDFNSSKYKLTNVSSEEVRGKDTSLIGDVLDVGSSSKQLQTMNKSSNKENILHQAPKNVLVESLETSSISDMLALEVERTSAVSETFRQTTKEKVIAGLSPVEDEITSESSSSEGQKQI
ncbi:uncharacterized protein LOC143248460 isoform X2 [Tachypleus tridentatus]